MRERAVHVEGSRFSLRCVVAWGVKGLGGHWRRVVETSGGRGAPRLGERLGRAGEDGERSRTCEAGRVEWLDSAARWGRAAILGTQRRLTRAPGGLAGAPKLPEAPEVEHEPEYGESKHDAPIHVLCLRRASVPVCPVEVDESHSRLDSRRDRDGPQRQEGEAAHHELHGLARGRCASGGALGPEVACVGDHVDEHGGGINEEGEGAGEEGAHELGEGDGGEEDHGHGESARVGRAPRARVGAPARGPAGRSRLGAIFRG
mmetsp:Transcript_1449/g.4126  ORF Transcript_1449/g.4126 Transcript_1449/m.4126 type:complete len:260 (+) Transcript_1449:453-1232(+)